jgi:signal transduction histidine kinase
VVAGVRDVSQRLRNIATASAEQSAGLREMSDSVGKLDEITRQNAVTVEESSLSARELVGRAETLQAAVASIRLRQGTADEARAMVDRALAQITTLGHATAMSMFRDRGQGFVDRDLYVFIVDRQGKYLLHSAKPEWEGRRVHEVPGIAGDRFVTDAWERTERGPGWIEYDILNAETGEVQPKASYMARVNEREVLGCGVYKGASDAAATPAVAGSTSSVDATVGLALGLGRRSRVR